MSKAAIDWVWTQSKAKGSHRLVMLALADHADENGVCWPSVARLAEYANISERQAQYIIRDLEAAGEIEVTRAVGRQNTSEYKIKGAMGCTITEIEKVQSSAEKVQSSADDAEKVQWAAPELTNTVDHYSSSIRERESVGTSLPPSQQSTNGNGAAVVHKTGSPYMTGLVLPGGHVPAGAGENAVQVYYERFHYSDPDAHLTRPKEDDLIRLCPDLDRLREVVTEYSRTNYRVGNVKLILDWYRDGVPARQANTNGGTHGNAITGNGKANGNGWNAGGRNGADSRKPWADYKDPQWTAEEIDRYGALLAGRAQ